MTNKDENDRGIIGFLKALNDFQDDYLDELRRDAIAKGKKPPEGSMVGFFAGLATLLFGDKIKALDDKFLDWELSREKRELEIEKVQAERQRYVPQTPPKDEHVLRILEHLRRNVRDRLALVAEQEKLIVEVRGRRKGQPLTEDDIREIEKIKEAVACYLDELLAK